MATVRPYRTYWDTKSTSWVYFDAVVGTTVVHNGSTLVIGTDDSSPTVATYYVGLKFDSITEPSWTSDGPIADAGMSLIVVLSQIATLAGGISGMVEIGDATGAWDETSTAAQMRAVVGGFGTLTGIVSKYGAPEAWWKTKALPVNGFILRVKPGDVTSKGGVLRMLTDPAPIMRYYYQYSPTTATRGDATERETLDADTLAILAGKKEYDRFELETTVKVSDRLPAQSDIEIDPVAGSQVPALARSMQWPDSATVDIPASGAIPVSLVTNTDLDTARGMPAETSLKLIKREGTEVTIAKAGQYVGDVTYGNDGMGELELRSILATAYNSRIANYSPYQTQTVDYNGERAIFILTDLLLNSASLKYDQIHYNNLAYLTRRFASVWTVLFYTQIDPPPAGYLGLKDRTVGEIITEIGALYNLAVSQTANGCISIWHPSVYRTSMRVWTIDEDDCLPGGYQLTKRGMEKQYGSFKISDDGFTGGSVQVTSAYLPNYIPSDPSFNERIKEVVAYGQCFVDHGSARAGIGRQLSQRYTGRYWEATLSLGMQGLAIDNGDVIKLTGTGLSTMARFIVIAVSGDPSSGRTEVTCVHYPDVLAVCNTFEDDGVEGEWRWLDETGAQDVTNMSPNGSDADPTTTTLATLSYEHWQGVIHGTGYTEWSVPLIDGSSHDIIDICTMVDPESGATVINYASWGDGTYLPIMVWRKAAGNEALAVGWYRPGYGVSTDPVTNTLFVAHINDYTAGSFTFATGVAYSPAGICGRESGTSGVPAAIALQWDDSGNVSLYVDRQLVASGTGYSKTDWTTVRILTQTDVSIGCVRHIQTDTEVTELQRLQGINGLDPFQP